MTAVPAQTRQRRGALATANSIKSRRAQLRNEVKARGRSGALLVARWLMGGTLPVEVRRLYAWQVLRWVPEIGDARAGEILRLAKVAPWDRTGRLSPRQRTAVAALLAVHAKPGRDIRYEARAKTTAAIRAANRAPAPVCRECGEEMMRATRDGRCGFCIAEENDGRAR